MIKSLLVLRIAGQNPHLFHHDVKEAVNAILDRIVSAMARRDRVELREFWHVCREGSQNSRGPQSENRGASACTCEGDACI